MKRINIIICLLLILQLSGVAMAQKTSNPNLSKDIEENYKKLLSEDFADRDQAVFFFNKQKKEDLSEEIFNAVITLFKQETEQHKGPYKIKKESGSKAGYDIGEAYGMYHSNLCELVGKTGETKILPLLVERCMDAKVLMNFGDAAVEPVMHKFLTTDNPMGKTSAIRVLGEMLKPKLEGYVVRGDIRTKVKKTLIQAASDNDNNIRFAAVKALGASEDTDVIPLLEKISKNDSYSFEKKDRTTSKMTTRYPVREEAEKALTKLKQKEVTQ